MKIKILVCFIATLLVLPLTGCATDSPGTSSSSVTASTPATPSPTTFAYEAANFLQEFNTGLQTALPTVDTILTATHNSNDAVYANIAASLLNSVAAAQKAAASTPTTSVQNQAAVDTVLAPANVASVASAAVVTTH